MKQAKLSTNVGERISDYLINLNYDMLGSPNFIFGIYDIKTVPDNSPRETLIGSQKVSDLFIDWFQRHKLPWDYTEFDGRSDYGPFLAEGIVCNGLFSGADEIKTKEQRDRYDHALGRGLGGIANVVTDPCYHAACDSLENINSLALEKMVQAAANILETLGWKSDLEQWLYPDGRPNIGKSKPLLERIKQKKEYFGTESF